MTAAPEPGAAAAGARHRARSCAQRFGFDGPTLVFAGRLTAQKSLDVGDRGGAPGRRRARDRRRRARPRRARAARLRALPRPAAAAEVLELFRAADASLLSSAWENFPHTVVEALAVGTPVIATRTGGVAEVLADGVNGLVVEPGDVDALTAAIERFFADPELAARLRANAAPSVADYAPERVYGRLEQILAAEAAARMSAARAVRRPHALPAAARASASRASGMRSSERSTCACSRAAPARTRASSSCRRGRSTGRASTRAARGWSPRELRRFRPDAVIAESPYEAAGGRGARRLARSPAKVIVEVHGDWRVSTRLYGSPPAARVLRPVGDRRRGLGRRPRRRPPGRRRLHRLDARASRGREPLGVFTTLLRPRRLRRPARCRCRTSRASLFVGVLERYKNVEGLAAALAARRGSGCPRRSCTWSATATLHRGRRGARAGGRRAGTGASSRRRSRRRLDASRALAPAVGVGGPAARRGRGASCAAAPSSATRAGGIPDIVEDGVNGLLVPFGDARALAAALERMLTEDGLAERLGEGAAAAAPRWVSTPEEYAPTCAPSSTRRSAV